MPEISASYCGGDYSCDYRAVRCAALPQQAEVSTFVLGVFWHLCHARVSERLPIEHCKRNLSATPAGQVVVRFACVATSAVVWRVVNRHLERIPTPGNTNVSTTKSPKYGKSIDFMAVFPPGVGTAMFSRCQQRRGLSHSSGRSSPDSRCGSDTASALAEQLMLVGVGGCTAVSTINLLEPSPTDC